MATEPEKTEKGSQNWWGRLKNWFKQWFKQRYQTINPDVLNERIDKLNLSDPEQKEYLKGRWLKQVEHWNYHARRNQLKYDWLSRVVIVCGILIPVVTGLQVGKSHFLIPIVDNQDLIVIALGLVVSICSAWLALGKYGEVWSLKKRAADLLHSEGWSYFLKINDYKDKGEYDQTFPLFANRAEEIIRRSEQDWLALAKPDQ